MLRESSNAVLRDDGLQALEVVADAAEGRAENVEVMVDTFSALFTQQAEADAESPHAGQKMILEKVQLRGDIPAPTIDDFPACR